MDNIPYDGTTSEPFIREPEAEEITPMEKTLYDIRVDDKWDLAQLWMKDKKKKLFEQMTSFNMDSDDLNKLGERALVYKLVAESLDEFTNWVEQNAKQVETKPGKNEKK